MITNIDIKNFKSFEHVAIECSYLNVLTGLNGMGKSSVIQTLLLLRQSYEKGLLQEGLALNGDLVQVGTVKDALYEFATKEELSFSLRFSTNNEQLSKDWFFTRVVNDPESTEEERTYTGSDFMPYSTPADEAANKDLTPLAKISLFGYNTFKYLNADRWVKNEYEVSDFTVVRNRSLGKHGQYTAHFINNYGASPIHTDLLFPETTTNELLFQVSAWMSEISPGTRIVTETIPGSESIKLRYVFEEGKISTNEIKPLNVGFGITYVLPVVVTLLSARKGDIIIIENPESHIHPKAQSMIGRLLAKVAATGTQVFVETHSDHIINGILVSIFLNNNKKEPGISAEKIKINFIRRKEHSFASEEVPIQVQENGRIKGIPEGFFDQYSNDMKTIIGF